MSKVVKGVTNTVKKVGKAIGGAVKGIVKGIGKVVKKVWESPLGKIALVAAAVYTGGVALGYFASPSALLGGAPLLTSQAATTAATTAGTTAGAASGVNSAALASAANGVAGTGVAGASTAIPAASTAIGTAATPGVASGAINTGLITNAANGAFNAGVGAAGAGAAGAGATNAAGIVGTIKSLAGGAASWAAANPIPAAIGLGAVSSAFQKTPAEEAQDAREEYWKNLQGVGDIDLGFGGGLKALKNLQGKPVFDENGGGIISGSMERPA